MKLRSFTKKADDGKVLETVLIFTASSGNSYGYRKSEEGEYGSIAVLNNVEVNRYLRMPSANDCFMKIYEDNYDFICKHGFPSQSNVGPHEILNMLKQIFGFHHSYGFWLNWAKEDLEELSGFIAPIDAELWYEKTNFLRNMNDLTFFRVDRLILNWNNSIYKAKDVIQTEIKTWCYLVVRMIESFESLKEGDLTIMKRNDYFLYGASVVIGKDGNGLVVPNGSFQICM